MSLLALIRRRWIYYKREYKKAVFTLLCIWQHRQDSAPAILPYEMILKIVSINPDEFDFQSIDSGIILMLHNNNPSSKSNARMAIEQISMQYAHKSIFGCYSTSRPYYEQNIYALQRIKNRTLVSFHEHHIWFNNTVMKSIRDAHEHKMTVILATSNPRSVPNNIVEFAAVIYSDLANETTLANRLGVLSHRLELKGYLPYGFKMYYLKG